MHTYCINVWTREQLSYMLRFRFNPCVAHTLICVIHKFGSWWIKVSLWNIHLLSPCKYIVQSRMLVFFCWNSFDSTLLSIWKLYLLSLIHINSVDKIIETSLSIIQYNSAALQTTSSKMTIELNPHLCKAVFYLYWTAFVSAWCNKQPGKCVLVCSIFSVLCEVNGIQLWWFHILAADLLCLCCVSVLIRSRSMMYAPAAWETYMFPRETKAFSLARS